MIGGADNDVWRPARRPRTVAVNVPPPPSVVPDDATLLWAVRRGIDPVWQLVQRGTGDPNARDSVGMTALERVLYRQEVTASEKMALAILRHPDIVRTPNWAVLTQVARECEWKRAAQRMTELE